MLNKIIHKTLEVSAVVSATLGFIIILALPIVFNLK